MRITIIGNFGRSWDGSICDEENLAVALERLGHEIHRFQRDDTREASWKIVPSDFTLISQWDGYGDDLVARCRHISRGPVVYWAFDYQHYAMGPWHAKLVNDCDIFLTKEAAHIPEYKTIGPDTAIHWLPADFAPDFLEPSSKSLDRDIEVLFTGSFLPHCSYRTMVLEHVAKHFDLHIYSNTAEDWKRLGFKNVFPAVVDEGLSDLIGRAKINLSVDLYQSDGFWSDRNAQIMACGGFTLFSHVPLSELVFRDNIGYFYSPADAVDKIQYHLDNPVTTEMTAMQGWSFAKKNLTATARAQDMLTIVKSYL